MTKNTVLVVEDDPLLSDLTREILTAEGFEVVEAATPAEMNAALDASRPHWLIVDFNLEGWDGLSAIQAARAAADVCLKVIALSGWPWGDTRLTDFMSAADHCMQKPVDWDELLRVLRTGESPPLHAS